MSLRKTSRKAKSVLLEGAGGDPAPVAASWEKGPAVLIFLRHFG